MHSQSKMNGICSNENRAGGIILKGKSMIVTMAIAYTEEEERTRNMIMIRGSYMKHRPIPYNTQRKENRLPIPDLAFEI